MQAIIPPQGICYYETMKITLCGSIAFLEHQRTIQKQLETSGHEVQSTPDAEPNTGAATVSNKDFYTIQKKAAAKEDWVWDMKEQAIRNHIARIEWADAILVVNDEKKGMPGYIGGNTFMEMGIAFYLRKPIYLLNPIPDMPYTEELRGLKPIVLNGDLSSL